jgi:hypothetical protein
MRYHGLKTRLEPYVDGELGARETRVIVAS